MKNINKLLSISKRHLLDTLFPISCLSCGAENFWLCPDCQTKINCLDIQLCPLCERELTLAGTLCPYCRSEKTSYLDSLLTAVSYENPAVRQLIHNLKYRFVADSSLPLAALMLRAALRHNLALPDVIVPVPLHARRLRWRGYNQSELLAKEISANLAPPLTFPVSNVLERKKYNRPQMEIKNYQDRLKNVRSIFSLKEDSAEIIRNKKVLLVDDIATTGATLQECARILKASGAKKVMAIVIARQTIK